MLCMPMTRNTQEIHEKPIISAHIEAERAAYITGTHEERSAQIKRIWDKIAGNPLRFRGPGHHAPSAPLHTHTLLPDHHSEILIRDTPGRHIYYFDTLSLALDQGGVQVRLEHKQKVKGVSLTETFYAATVKIGDKATQRIEETVKMDLDLWREKGFYTALKAGIRAEVEALDGSEAIRRKKELRALKKALIEAIGHDALKALKVFPLGHLMRDTIETRYSPSNDPLTIIEPKTDMCEAVDALSQMHSFSQFEAEGIEGDFCFVEELVAQFCADPDLRLVPTNDSKITPILKGLRPWLVPQDSSASEALRTQTNRVFLEKALSPLYFKPVRPGDLGLLPPPAPENA